MRSLLKWLFGGGLAFALLAALLGIFGGAGAYTAYYAEGASYLSNDPKACVNCHIMRDQYDGWQKASHHSVATCNDCHVPQQFVPKYLAKAESGFWHSKGFTLQDFHEPIRIHDRNSRHLQANCIRCHQEAVCEILDVGGKEDHTNCVRCHSTVGHGPSR